MISVIIPYYCNSNPVQTERLLHRAILSASKELRECDSYEIVVVDDGSAFPPQNIQSEFGYNLPIRFFQIPHGCLGAARNYGIERAKGDYIMFLDADDYYFPGKLSVCIDRIKKSHAEVLMYGMKKVTEYAILTLRHTNAKFSGPISGNDFMTRNNLPGSSCSFIIHRSLLNRENLRFRENSFLEDEDFTPRLLHHCKSIIFTQLPVYAYYTREGSIVNKLNKETTKRIDIAIEVIERLLEFRSNHSEEPHSGLDRKIDTLALDCIRLGLRDDNWRKVTAYSAEKLKAFNLYPLSEHNYSLRHTLYRHLLRCSTGLQILRIIEKSGL